MSPSISAIQHIRSLRGGAQAQLVAASDGNYYVTKFRNNPQHVKVLANEMFATRLGLALGLPMPRVEVIEVPTWLIEQAPNLRINLAVHSVLCSSGKQLGVLYAGSESSSQVLDYLPESLFERVFNVADFAKVLVLDKWTANADGRQAVFCRKTPRSKRYVATFIDQGYCFNASEWNFPDYPLRGVYANNCVYQGVEGWDAFEPALTKAEEMDSESIWQCAAGIPEEWYEGDREGLHRLVDELFRRRCMIRRLINIFRESARNPFPNWSDRSAIAVPSGQQKGESLVIG